MWNVCEHDLAFTHILSSLPASIILILTPIRVQRRSLWRFKQLMTCVFSLLSCLSYSLTVYLTQVLKDDKKRAEYDKYGAASQQPGFDANAYENARSAFGGGFGGFGGFHEFSGAFGGRSGGGSDMFEQLFGTFGGAAGGGRTQFVRGGDITAAVSISFMEACKGTTRTINITPIVECDTCHGSGLKAGATRSTCHTCRGSGVNEFVVNNFRMQATCSSCNGTGSTVPSNGRCGTCAGIGHVRVRKAVTINIPAGECRTVLMVDSNRLDCRYQVLKTA